MNAKVALSTVKRLVKVALPMKLNPAPYDVWIGGPLPAAPFMTLVMESKEDPPSATKNPMTPVASPPRPPFAPAESPPRPPWRVKIVFDPRVGEIGRASCRERV